jgi:histidyl-tRNA synthetase
METVKGFKDYLGEQALKREAVKEILIKIFKKYGFEPAETPIMEYEKFVKGENTTDEAISDIFKLQDKGKRKLALRYELTFPLKRIIKNQKLPYKRYQIGAVFRDEPASSEKQRFREFTQCDIDVIGSSVRDEAEVLKTIKRISEKLGFKSEIFINNRKLLNEILKSQGIKEKDINSVIREIDKLDKLPEAQIKKNLKKYDAESVLLILKKPESYFKKFKSYKYIEELKKYCKIYNVNVKFQPSLARGLSYYNGTIFEAKTKNTKQSFAGGGAFSINTIPSIGYGIGLQRLCNLAEIPDKLKENKILIISINQDKKAINLAEKLRQKNLAVDLYTNKGISKALDYANSKKIKKVIFLGKSEVLKNKLKLRDMKTGKEKLISEKELLNQK